MPKPIVFISHSSDDSDYAKKICSFLEEYGIKCWIAPRDISPGTAYSKEITRGIKECQIFLVILTKQSVHSRHVNTETDIAFNSNKHIIPFFADNVALGDSMTYYLARKQWILGYIDFKASLTDLLDSILNLETPEPHDNPIEDSVEHPVKEEHTSEKSRKKNNKFKFLLSYKGCMISIAFVLIGFIFMPFLFMEDPPNDFSSYEDKEIECNPTFGSKRPPKGAVRPENDNGNSYEDNESGALEEDVAIIDNVMVLQGKVAGKAAELKMTADCNYNCIEIDVELIIDGVRFHNSCSSYLDRKTLNVDLDNNDGTFIGSFDGLLSIENGSLTYIGDVLSQDKTELFKDGTFIFKGIANDNFIKMYQSQFNDN